MPTRLVSVRAPAWEYRLLNHPEPNTECIVEPDKDPPNLALYPSGKRIMLLVTDLPHGCKVIIMYLVPEL